MARQKAGNTLRAPQHLLQVRVSTGAKLSPSVSNSLHLFIQSNTAMGREIIVGELWDVVQVPEPVTLAIDHNVAESVR